MQGVASSLHRNAALSFELCHIASVISQALDGQTHTLADSLGPVVLQPVDTGPSQAATSAILVPNVSPSPAFLGYSDAHPVRLDMLSMGPRSGIMDISMSGLFPGASASVSQVAFNGDGQVVAAGPDEVRFYSFCRVLHSTECMSAVLPF